MLEVKTLAVTKPEKPKSQPLAFHITMRLFDDGGVARSVAALRLAARILYQHGTGRGLLGFRVADTHIHVIVACSRYQAGRFALYAGAGLHKRLALAVGFEPSRIRPIMTEQHLANALRYVLVQETHHGTTFDPLHEGSSLPELVGARRLDKGILERVRRALPRIPESRFVEWMGATGFERAPRDFALVAEAAAAALGIADLRGHGEPQRVARVGAVHALAEIAPYAPAGELLGIPARSLHRYRQQKVERWLLRAIDRQVQLRVHLAARRPAEA